MFSYTMCHLYFCFCELIIFQWGSSINHRRVLKNVSWLFSPSSMFVAIPFPLLGWFAVATLRVFMPGELWMLPSASHKVWASLVFYSRWQWGIVAAVILSLPLCCQAWEVCLPALHLGVSWRRLYHTLSVALPPVTWAAVVSFPDTSSLSPSTVLPESTSRCLCICLECMLATRQPRHAHMLADVCGQAHTHTCTCTHSSQCPSSKGLLVLSLNAICGGSDGGPQSVWVPPHLEKEFLQM